MSADIARELAARIEVIRMQDDTRHDWMTKLLAQLTTLTQGYEDARKDVERERIVRSQTQTRADILEQQLRILQQCVTDTSFILVLIDADADAYMFQDEYYRRADGGQKAALDLQARVREYFEKAKPDLARLPVVVKAFANVDGMSKFLVNNGMIRSSSSMSGFAKGFSQASATSDFVLVGHGKDRADKKIKGVFEQFVRNPTCCQIVFGACHDNGYVRMLEDFALESAMIKRVTLLHSFSTGKEFAKLPFQSMRMDTVFRTAPLDGLESPLAVVSRKRPRIDSTDFATRKPWAISAESNPPRSSSTVSEGTNHGTDRTIWVNAIGQRVDSRLPQPVQAAPEVWSRRANKIKQKYCRAYHIRGDCRGGCTYLHGPLSDEEKLAFRKSLREKVCHTGLTCRDVDCYYGHNCTCDRDTCRFPREMHGVAVDSAEVWRP